MFAVLQIANLDAMSTASKRAPRSVDELAPADRRRLEDAHRRLRDAIKGYEPFLGGALEPGEPVPMHDVRALAAAQAEIEEAEAALWRLREKLLGWERPSWAPSAGLVSDWFSDEDRIYDERS